MHKSKIRISVENTCTVMRFTNFLITKNKQKKIVRFSIVFNTFYPFFVDHHVRVKRRRE